MYPLFESIRLEDGRFDLLSLHRARIEHTLHRLYGKKAKIDLGALLAASGPPRTGRWKCRFSYGPEGYRLEYIPYKARQINRLVLINAPNLLYPFKYSDRSALDNCREGLTKEEEVILCRAGRITDSTYSNLVFWDGKEWHTPQYPLFYGVRRAFLLDQGRIKMRDLFIDDLEKYSTVRLINALLPLKKAPEVQISAVEPRFRQKG